MHPALRALAATLPENAILTGEAAKAQAYTPWGTLGAPLAILRPATTDQVAACLRIASAHALPITPWGGKTGLVAGTYADGIVALSLERMNAIESIDPDAATLTAEAGCILATACAAAEARNLLLPLDLGARGSATIGGLISTNAGGNRVLRFGMMRDMVLGLETVLADGTIVSAMKPLIKNNTGYDLKQLFIGSEGTLGIVTRAVLRLRPLPASQLTALLAVDSFQKLPKLLRRLEAEFAGTLSAFEVMWPEFYHLVTTPPALGTPILPHGANFYVLTEAMGAHPDPDRARFESVLAACLEDGLAQDAVIAKSQAETRRLWALRDDVAQLARNAPVVHFDVSLPIAGMESYLATIRARLTARWPDHTLVVFGHLGDGNLHVIVGVGDESARHAVEQIIYEALPNGSVSAEHGIGLLKREWLPLSRSAPELAVMRAMKSALDPQNILNRGKVLA